MSDPTSAAADAHGDHEPDDAGHGHAGHDEHGDHAQALGPVDWLAWGAGILGVAAGLAVAFCLLVATNL